MNNIPLSLSIGFSEKPVITIHLNGYKANSAHAVPSNSAFLLNCTVESKPASKISWVCTFLSWFCVKTTLMTFRVLAPIYFSFTTRK